MSIDHEKFHFSVTVQTDDRAVLFCLRALCQFTEKHAKPQIGWGGTETKDWIAAGNQVTFRFTTSACRDLFVKESDRLLKRQWRIVTISDTDPARPQRSRRV